jgi:hypothetical protein
MGNDSSLQARAPALRLRTLLYRFVFFDWLFDDMRGARTRLEHHAAAQHNRRMGRYLPRYLRRWICFTLLGFALGCLVEQALASSLLSAWFFTWACITATGSVVIGVAWLFLQRAQAP